MPLRHKSLPVNLFPVFIFGMQIFKICNRYRKQESTIMRKTFRHPQDPEASIFERPSGIRRIRKRLFFESKETDAAGSKDAGRSGSFNFLPQRHKKLPVNLFPVFIFGMQIFKICNRYRKQESTIYPKDLPASEGSGSVFISDCKKQTLPGQKTPAGQVHSTFCHKGTKNCLSICSRFLFLGCRF